jgi:hypothetical protein
VTFGSKYLVCEGHEIHYTEWGAARGPRAVVVTLSGCGHAPALNVPDQLQLVERFLDGR